MKVITNYKYINTNDLIENEVFFVEDNNIKSILKIANKKRIYRILFKDPDSNRDYVLFKIGKIWKTIDHFLFNISIIKENNLTLENKFKGMFDEINFSKDKFDVFMEDNSFIYKKNNSIELKLSFLLNDFFQNNIYSENKYSIRTKEFDYSSLEKIDIFLKKVNNKKIPGVDIERIKSNEERTIIFTKKGKFTFIKDKNKIILFTIGEASTMSESDFYTNSLNNNINNNIFEIRTQRRKITPSNIIWSLIGFAFVILITYLTFDKIFGKSQMSSAFEIMSSSYTWTQIWIYIIIVNFITTFMFMFISVFVFSVLIQRRKPNWRNTLNFFMSAQIRSIFLFLTGNLIISTIIWGLYLNKTSKIRTSALVATLGITNLIKSIGTLMNSAIFMIPASIYLWNEFPTINDALMVTFLSYGGVLYTIAQDSLIAIMIMLPILHPLYFKIKVLISSKGKYSFSSIRNATNDIESLKNSIMPIFKDKTRISRILVTTFILVIFEAIETSSIFQMCENYSYHFGEFKGIPQMENHATYLNFFPIAGARMMSNYVRHFPLLNLIPGQGVGITDYFLKHVNEIIIAKQHHISVGEISTYYDQISLVSTRVTFITRFFNFYITKIISLIITIAAIIKIIILKYTKKLNV